jgi:hypothetical protein
LSLIVSLRDEFRLEAFERVLEIVEPEIRQQEDGTNSIMIVLVYVGHELLLM